MSNNQINKNNIAIVAGILLILFGLWRLSVPLFGTLWGDMWRFVSFIIGILWPLVIIAGGVFLMVAARKGRLELPKDKKLFRSSNNKKLGGVCGGIAEYLSIEPSAVRVVAIALAILNVFVMVPLYVLFWIFVPYDTKNYNTWV
ncbi:MAG: PspC domain-containing protein [Coriobacteriia bacterium]|jgi:phage shock protein PspC (stress-responsive transcriptional regulator)|nr:PspC domain-containing protein [Coriobacteriia bacterium]